MTTHECRPPLIEHVGNLVILHDSAVVDVSRYLTHAVRVAEAEARRDGFTVSPRVRDLEKRFADAARHILSMSPTGHERQTSTPLSAPSEYESSTVDSAEAATIIGVTTRHVARIKDDLDARRVGRNLQFDRAAVIDYAQHRISI